MLYLILQIQTSKATYPYHGPYYVIPLYNFLNPLGNHEDLLSPNLYVVIYKIRFWLIFADINDKVKNWAVWINYNVPAHYIGTYGSAASYQLLEYISKKYEISLEDFDYVTKTLTPNCGRAYFEDPFHLQNGSRNMCVRVP